MKCLGYFSIVLAKLPHFWLCLFLTQSAKFFEKIKKLIDRFSVTDKDGGVASILCYFYFTIVDLNPFNSGFVFQRSCEKFDS